MENEQGQTASDANAMKTLSELINRAVNEGYTENFSVQEQQLFSASAGSYFAAEDTHILNFYRFEGISNPDDEAILYLIETTNGIKGTLTDAYGAYASEDINEFILRVNDIHKKGA